MLTFSEVWKQMGKEWMRLSRGLRAVSSLGIIFSSTEFESEKARPTLNIEAGLHSWELWENIGGRSEKRDRVLLSETGNEENTG